VYTHTIEYYSAIKKNEMMSFVGKWMELEIIMLSQISQAQRQTTASSHSFVIP
jgi:hypothetical protein